jgi:rod shape-determining protein MreC
MEGFLNRYRNITVLLLVIFAQLVLLAFQVKNDQDVRFIRVWAVTMVTPAARIAEWFRGGSIGFIRNYILLKDANEENRKLRDEVGRLRIENNFLHNELNTADRAKALEVFRARRQSKMLAANVIGAAGGMNSNVVYVNRGSAEGVMRGMAVVTPDGIVGKVMSAYPTAAEVVLITDPDFAAGVISQKSLSRGVLRGQGKSKNCKVDNVPFEEKVEAGEWFYTSGDDRVFPRGFPVGIAKVVRPGSPYKDIEVEPSGTAHGLEDVLILLETVHDAIPETPPASQPMYIAPPPPGSQQTTAAPADPSGAGASGPSGPSTGGTEADKLLRIYKSVGDAQNHTFGAGGPGSRPPDFKNLPGSAGAGVVGPSGARGTSGPSGARGPGAGGQGVQAPSAQGLGVGGSGLGTGASGPSGARGTSGPSGTRGPGAGASGPSGARGLTTGASGPSGVRGPGASGPSGARGSGTGASGPSGARGPGPGGQGTGSVTPPPAEQGGRSNAAPPKGPGGAPRE